MEIRTHGAEVCFVRQKFDGVTAAKDEEKFKDPETGEFVFMWTHGEWV